jgi:hypothetical protein
MGAAPPGWRPPRRPRRARHGVRCALGFPFFLWPPHCAHAAAAAQLWLWCDLSQGSEVQNGACADRGAEVPDRGRGDGAPPRVQVESQPGLIHLPMDSLRMGGASAERAQMSGWTQVMRDRFNAVTEMAGKAGKAALDKASERVARVQNAVSSGASRAFAANGSPAWASPAPGHPRPLSGPVPRLGQSWGLFCMCQPSRTRAQLTCADLAPLNHSLSGIA